MTIELNEAQSAFVRERVADGTFRTVDDLVAAAFEMLEDDLRQLGDVKALRAAIEEGEASGIYEGDIFEDLRKRYGLPSRAA